MEHQQRRQQFIQERPYFRETINPYGLIRKLGQESVELVKAFIHHLFYPTIENKRHLGEELADVFHSLIDIASFAGIDLLESASSKLNRDEERFPSGTPATREDYRRIKRIEHNKT